MSLSFPRRSNYVGAGPKSRAHVTVRMRWHQPTIDYVSRCDSDHEVLRAGAPGFDAIVRE
jgi:hypothetical protein